MATDASVVVARGRRRARRTTNPLARRAIRLLATIALLAPARRAGAQNASADVVAAVPLGVWTGTSLCLQGRPVCKDEQVVYRLERAGAGDADTVPLRLTANKIVRGAEEEMGAFACRYAMADAQLTCPMPPRYARGEWRFRRVDGALVGGLWLDGRGQVRTVRVQAKAPDGARSAPSSPPGAP